MFFKQGTLKSPEKPMLPNSEISKMYLSGTDVCSEYQPHISPAFLMTPPAWLTSTKLKQPCLPSPALSRFPISENGSSVCSKKKRESHPDTFVSSTINRFTSWGFLQCIPYSPIPRPWPLSNHHDFMTRLAPHSWLHSISFHMRVSFKNTNHGINMPTGFLLLLELSAQIWLWLMEACRGLTPANLSDLISHHSIPYWPSFGCSKALCPSLSHSFCICCLSISTWNPGPLLTFTPPAHYPLGLSLDGIFLRKPPWLSVMSSTASCVLVTVFMIMVIIFVIIY